MEQNHVKSTVEKHPKVFAVVTAVVKSLWQRMKNQFIKSRGLGLLDNLVGGLKIREIVKMSVETLLFGADKYEYKYFGLK